MSGVQKASEGVKGKLEEAKVNGGKNGLKIAGSWYLASERVYGFASEKLVGKPVIVEGEKDGVITMLKYHKTENSGSFGGGKGKGGFGGKGGGFQKKDDDYALGQQVGNAITNAATICGAGTSVEDLFKVAEQIIIGGNALKEKIKAGKLGAESSSSKPASKPKQEASFEEESSNDSGGFDDSGFSGEDSFDDDIPW